MLISQLCQKEDKTPAFIYLYLGQKKKLLCCPLPTDRKMRIFFLLLLLLKMSDLGEEFAKICIQWPKKALVYMPFDCILPEFSPFRNFLKNIGKLNSLMVRKKIKNQKSTDRPNFQILVGVRAT